MVKIFLVEDDPLLVKMYEKKFTLEKFDVEIALDGQQAIDKLNTNTNKYIPDVVLLDIMMPKLNGLDVLKQMKETPALKDIPVIMLTNLSSSDDIKKSMALGAHSYLVKSDYTPTQVVEKVQETISKK